MPAINAFLLGGTALASAAISLVFLRFWREVHDRLFAYFAVAFFVMALHPTAIAIFQPSSETRHLFYLFRLAAFLIIIWAIIDKNRTAP
jgi:hypothetical protein